MQQVDIVYVAGMHGDALVPALAQFCVSRELSFRVISENDADAARWAARGIDVLNIREWVEADRGAGNVEDQFSVNIDDLIRTERSYYRVPSPFLRAKARSYLHAAARICGAYEFRIVLQMPGGEILRRVFFRFGELGFVPANLCFGESYVDGLSMLYLGEYKTPARPNAALDRDEVAAALERFGQSGKRIDYKSRLEDQRWPRRKTLRALAAAGNWNVIASYVYHRLLRPVFCRLGRILTSWVYTPLPAEGVRSVFFPLNVAAESELFVRNSLFASQFSTLRWLVTKLPATHRLYAKEHPGDSVSLTALQKALLRLRGVRFLRPELGTREVLAQAELTIVVSSTVAFEAICAGKPVVCLGYWPYARMTGTEPSQSPDELVRRAFDRSGEYVYSVGDFAEQLALWLWPGSIYADYEQVKMLLSQIATSIGIANE